METVHRAAHVPGIQNSEADEESRTANDDTEWSLDPDIFNKINDIQSEISVGLFTSNFGITNLGNMCHADQI